MSLFMRLFQNCNLAKHDYANMFLLFFIRTLAQLIFSSYFYAPEVLVLYLKKMQTWISLHQNKLTFPHRQVRMSIINQVKISQWVKSLFEESIIKYFSKHFVRCTHSRQWASSRCMHLHWKSVCASLFSDYYKVV